MNSNNLYILKKDEINKIVNNSTINENGNYYLFCSSTNDINIEIKENVNAKVVLLSNIDKNTNITFNVERDSVLSLYTADFISSDITLNKTVNLNGHNSTVNVYEYISLDNKKVDGSFNINHNYIETKSLAKMIYLVNNNSQLLRSAIASIKEGIINCDTSESIKGIILSKDSKIISRPVLKIAVDEVKASHGCAIGTIDDNEIYYLMSRGLTREEAFRIITKSFINPILKEIENDDFLKLALELFGEKDE